jgi:hypothetical protein
MTGGNVTRTNRNVPNRYPLRHPHSINEKSKLSEILNDPDVIELPVDKLSRMKTRLGRGGSLPDAHDDIHISAYFEKSEEVKRRQRD